MQVILDSLFVSPSSAPIGGGKKGEFRDWTRVGGVSGSRAKPLPTPQVFRFALPCPALS